MRAAAGLEQKQVARALRCTVTKVSYFENAQRPVVPRDLDEILLPLYGVAEEEWPRYLAAAEKARKKGWWEEYDDDVLPDWFRRYVGFEQGAASLQSYQSSVVSGLMQTTDYMAALMDENPVELTDDQVQRRIELRLRRQEVVTRQSSPLECWVVLDEAVLWRAIGGTKVMRAQLDHLVDIAQKPNVTLQVLPFSRGAHPGIGTGFTILRFPWDTDPGVVYLESGSSAGLYLEELDEIDDHTRIFDRLCVLSLGPDASMAMVRELTSKYS